MSTGSGQRAAGKTCPVCDVSMEGLDPVGHSQLHFPAEPIPARPETLKARIQQAQLLGREEPKE